MHNDYFYPEDVVVEIIDGKRRARIGWELPVLHTEETIKLSKIDPVSGWESARINYRKSITDAWYQKTYQAHWLEHLKFKAHLENGGSVTSYHKKES